MKKVVYMIVVLFYIFYIFPVCLWQTISLLFDIPFILLALMLICFPWRVGCVIRDVSGVFGYCLVANHVVANPINEDQAYECRWIVATQFALVLGNL